MALLGDDDVGLFVTTAGFTKDAEERGENARKEEGYISKPQKLFDSLG